MPDAVQARPIAARNLSPPKPWNTRRSGTRSSRGQRSITAPNRTEEIFTQRGRRFRVVDVVPFEEGEALFVGLLQVEAF